MNNIFNWIEKKTLLILVTAISILLICTLSVPIYLFFENGEWIIGYDTNGQIGDFFGGILNPLIAFLALVWIAKGVLMQKQELEETKIALKDSASYQALQAQSTVNLVKLNAMTALISALNSKEAAINIEIEQLNQLEKSSGIFGINQQRISDLLDIRKSVIEQRDSYAIKIKEYL